MWYGDLDIIENLLTDKCKKNYKSPQTSKNKCQKTFTLTSSVHKLLNDIKHKVQIAIHKQLHTSNSVKKGDDKSFVKFDTKVGTFESYS